MADPFPLYFPPEARRLFQTESLLRRFAQMAQWEKGSALLEIFGSLSGLALTKALDCTLTVVEPEARVSDTLKERAKVAGIGDKVTFSAGPVTALSFPQGSFDGIFSFGRVVGLPRTLAKSWRPMLAERGRIGFTTVVKVSRSPSDKALEYWKSRLGTPLLLPREALLAVEDEGYEPEMVETVGDLELDEYYKELEAALAKTNAAEPGPASLRAEIDQHRALNGKTGVTMAFVIARRKEPGEKPPLSRDSG